MTTFNPSNPKVLRVVTNMVNLLQYDADIAPIFRNVKILNSKRQSKSLRALLCPSKFNYQGIVTKCGKSGCQLCDIILEGPTLTFKKSEKPFEIRNNMNCEANDVIYILICTGCHSEYIGATNNLRLRMNLHKDQIRNERTRTLRVSHHIHQCARPTNKEPGFKFMPFYKSYHQERSMLLLKENHFIIKFDPSLNDHPVHNWLHVNDVIIDPYGRPPECIQ